MKVSNFCGLVCTSLGGGAVVSAAEGSVGEPVGNPIIMLLLNALVPTIPLMLQNCGKKKGQIDGTQPIQPQVSARHMDPNERVKQIEALAAHYKKQCLEKIRAEKNAAGRKGAPDIGRWQVTDESLRAMASHTVSTYCKLKPAEANALVSSAV